MIKINGDYADISEIINKYPQESTGAQVLNIMNESNEDYTYNSLDELTFELNLRKEIVNSAKELNRSGPSFEVFEKSMCNEEYWERTNIGGFKLRKGVNLSDAINDIYINGNKYGTECATAAVIVYYKALLNVFKEEFFNKTFTKIYLMGWEVEEPLLKEVSMLQRAQDIIPGDRKYFANPDFDLEFPEWQGENAFNLSKDIYYGHGIGIMKADRIIHELNQKRKDDTTKSAILMDSAGRPDFKKLAKVYYRPRPQNTRLVWSPFPAY